MSDDPLIIGKLKLLRNRGGRPPDPRYAILRVGKIKTKGQLGAALAHNLRERHTPNADVDRLGDNIVLKGPGNGRDVIAAWEARAPETIRKNAVHALEYFIGASPEKMAAMSRNRQDAYFRKALDWFEARHGADNVLSAVIHRDETTPHMQILVIPLDARGRLNARELVGGKATLSKMQTDFAREVGQDFGLERGRERSQATHQTIREYYGRANTPLETDFRLPERHKGNVLGVGKESDEAWRQRATEAAKEAIARTKAQYEHRLIQIERGAAQLLDVARSHGAALKALRRETGRTTPEERQMASVHMDGLLITARTRHLSRAESRELVEATETVLGPEAMTRLREGDVRDLPGDTWLDKAERAIPILLAQENTGRGAAAALDRIDAELERQRPVPRQQESPEIAQAPEHSSARAIEPERQHSRIQDRDRDDDWEL